MNITFKNSNTPYEVFNPIEKKAFKGDITGWLMSFVIKGDFASSNEVDALLSQDNISEFKLIDGDKERTVTGYEKVISAAIHYTENDSVIVEVQLSKGV